MADAELFNRMVPYLKSRGVTDIAIERVKKYWVNAPTSGATLPCPLCFLCGLKGRLTPLDKHAAAESLRCRDCGETIDLETP
jgi:hypothetical protein